MGSLGHNDGAIEVHRSQGIKEEGIGEHQNMFIIMGTSIVVRMTGEGISVVGRTWFVKQVNVVVTKCEDIASEMVVDLLRAAIVLEILMIGENINDKFSS